MAGVQQFDMAWSAFSSGGCLDVHGTEYLVATSGVHERRLVIKGCGCINSLSPRNAILWLGSWSTLVLVMARRCNRKLEKVRELLNTFLWKCSPDMTNQYGVETLFLKITVTFPGDHRVNQIKLVVSCWRLPRRIPSFWAPRSRDLTTGWSWSRRRIAEIILICWWHQWNQSPVSM